MRTTLTLDEDVAAELRHIQVESGATWRQVVNDVLRAGVATRRAGQPPARRPGRTKAVRLGRPVVPDISNVHEVLSLGERGPHR
ncbi:MAG: DUF2191 domain-containing protein [Acidimicrobiia bacterium]